MGLWSFIKKLSELNELVEINTPVSPELEITEIVDRISKSGSLNKALLFKNTGTRFPILINMYGNDRRMAAALGFNSLDEVGAHIETLIKEITEAGGEKKFFDKLKILFSLKELASFMLNHKGKRCLPKKYHSISGFEHFTGSQTLA
jgi:4-hydroxy-3-polyprenylbenzoate decarboxylase